MAIPFGRWFGVHVRIHLSFLLLLALSAGYSAVATQSMVRGVGLWLALVAAVLVREVARAVAAAYAGMPLRALFLLPFGGVMALQPSHRPRPSQRLIALTGSFANFGVALLLLGFAYGVDPHVALLRQPWITVEHILRSAIWLQVALGVVNLLPTRTLSLQRFLRPRSQRTAAAGAQAPGVVPSFAASESATNDAAARQSDVPAALAGRRPAFGVGTAIALALIVSGFFLAMLWPVLLGFTLLFMNYVGRLAAVGSGDAATLTVADVMLTEFTPLPASGTLRDALRRTTHTLEDTFPVVRGDRLVGWISRGALATRLQAEGDGYLQGVMTRSLQLADPLEKLAYALRRAATLGASEFIPVVENGAMVGMLTPANLERAVGQMRLTQPSPDRGAHERG